MRVLDSSVQKWLSDTPRNLLLVVAALCLINESWAGDNEHTPTADMFIPAAAAAANTNRTPDTGEIPKRVLSPEDIAEEQKVAQAEAEFEVASLTNARDQLAFQYRSTVIIFYLVISLVAFGLVLTAFQFFGAKKISRTKKVDDPDTHEITIKANEIHLRSKVVGLAILVISLGFFYLYLKTVYPLTLHTSATQR